jgi:hypothetical protein
MKRYELSTHDDTAVICTEDEKGAWVEVDYVLELLKQVRHSVVQRKLELLEISLNQAITDLSD